MKVKRIVKKKKPSLILVFSSSSKEEEVPKLTPYASLAPPSYPTSIALPTPTTLISLPTTPLGTPSALSLSYKRSTIGTPTREYPNKTLYFTNTPYYNSTALTTPFLNASKVKLGYPFLVIIANFITPTPYKRGHPSKAEVERC
jgi:hypothetical protein